ncbi:IS110 family transposase [Pseudomonas rossensis]|uniref:IS110 family transposase n=1 Tax=Pseudomonas rossensis TaxID=2305471 RepID=UPI00326093BA
MKLMRLGVGLAKNVFQIHGVDRHEQPVWQQRLPRDRWLQTVQEKIEPGCEIGMERCGGAHYWAPQPQARGFRVRLIAPQFVKPYVQSNKHDTNDAEAICEAMSRRSMRFVAIKTIEQQDIQVSVLRTAKSKDDRLSRWVVRLAERSPPNVAAIALANKTACMAWAMLPNGTDYQPDRTAA